MNDDAVVCEVAIRARPAAAFDMFTDPRKLVQWIGVRALLAPRPGPTSRVELVPRECCSGRYLGAVPGRRVVLTWGWETDAMPVRAGSTTVEVDLDERDGTTLVRVTHRGLEAAVRRWHADGWRRYPERLAAAADRRRPGPGPAAAYAGTGPQPQPPEDP
jgi:uncharacterized protein YndB with AHSA1/START domain